MGSKNRRSKAQPPEIQLLDFLYGEWGEYFWEIRIFIIRLLKYRDISLNDRLILLGSFCQKLQEHIDNKTIDSIPSLFGYYNNWLEDDSSLASLGNIPA